MNPNFDDLVKAAKEATNIAIACMRRCLGEDVKLPEKKWIELAMNIFIAGSVVDDNPKMSEDIVSRIVDEFLETEAE